jgi:hypothetical protein
MPPLFMHAAQPSPVQALPCARIPTKHGDHNNLCSQCTAQPQHHPGAHIPVKVCLL